MGSSQSQQRQGTGMFGQSAPSSGMFGQSAPQPQQSSSWFGGRKRKSRGNKKNIRKTKRRR